MHLQLAPPEGIDDGAGARDLRQPPADIVILSAADTELSALARAAGERPAEAPDVALTNFLQLGHPMSVDLYVERTLARARYVVLRLLGGESYWPHGIASLRRLALGRRVPFACLPGDGRWDPAFAARGTLPPGEAHALWRYFAEGGPENMRGALAFIDHALGGAAPPPDPLPVPSAGAWPREVPSDGRPRAAIVFYRALVQGGMTGPVTAVANALEARGIAAQPVFVTSLKDEASVRTLASLFAASPPDIVLNATAFAVGTPGEAAGGVLDGAGCPVLQVAFAGSGEAEWRASPRGLSPRDLAMHVVLPEIDGRIFAGAVAFKERAADAPPFAPTESRALPEQVEAAADLAAAWVRLRRARPAGRRVALIVANYPNRDGRLANGVGLDTPESVVLLAEALRGAGYRVDGAPATSAELMALLTAGPTNALREPSFHHAAADDLRTGLSLDPSPAGEGESAPADRGGVDATAAGATPPRIEAALRLGPPLEGRDQAPTGWPRRGGTTWPLDAYRAAYAGLPEATRAAVEARWGPPERDPHVEAGAFRLGVHRFGNLVLGIQPARGYHVDPKETYHAPDLAPPHHYLACYLWLRTAFDAHAVVHVGKHGNLEWLPGKATGLSAACFPRAILGPLPNIYPFIVNDPGEGMQAKRRTAAVIVDHLTPPLARAELHGDLADLERLADEYALAADLDPRRAGLLAKEIAASAGALRLDDDLGLAPGLDEGEVLRRIDAHLCDLKEMQIRDGLHVFGRAPEAGLRDELLVAMARLPRSELRPEDASLHRALAADLGLEPFDPLTRDLAAPWMGPRPAALAALSGTPWRIAGDAVERIEILAGRLVDGAAVPDPGWGRTRAVLGWIEAVLRPRIGRSGPAETASVLAALDGRFVAPGPSGAPTRGRPDVLPTGRNFFAVDTRAVPSATAWRTGREAAERLVERYWQEEGEWPRAIALSVWGTANMRTGGDDVAQALALIGARPVWEPGSGRVTGFQVMRPDELNRPRVDVTMRVSGLFRDAFPVQIDLFDSAVRAIAALDEADADNPIAAHARAEEARLAAAGHAPAAAARAATARVFGSKPGAYGAGLQAPVDEGGWETRAGLAAAYLAWSGFAYGGGREGHDAADLLRANLARSDAVVQAQDNREHDILDSDDYYQFMGGLAASVETVRGRAPPVFHLDTSRPEAPLARTLGEEVARVVRGRAANPRWIAGVMRHGYKGAFEIAATVDYLFGFAASTDAVKDHHFDQLFEAYLESDEVRAFLAGANPAALREIADRFGEALRRGLWRPRSNRAAELLAGLSGRPVREAVAGGAAAIPPGAGSAAPLYR